MISPSDIEDIINRLEYLESKVAELENLHITKNVEQVGLDTKGSIISIIQEETHHISHIVETRPFEMRSLPLEEITK